MRVSTLATPLRREPKPASSPQPPIACSTPPSYVQGNEEETAATHVMLLELSSDEGLGHHFGEGVYQFWILPTTFARVASTVSCSRQPDIEGEACLGGNC